MLHNLIKRGHLINSNELTSGSTLPGLLQTPTAESWVGFDDVEKIDWRVPAGRQGIKRAYINRLFIPNRSNPVTANSVLITNGSRNKPQVLLIQATAGKTQDIKTVGLQAIKGNMPAAATKDTWRLIFATHESNTELGGLQKFKGDEDSVEEWEAKLDQCIWRVPDDILWLA
jgi:hypothetical protein